MFGLIVHGGCHDLEPTELDKVSANNGVKTYGEIGYKMLSEGCAAIDVVEKVITMMEDDPIFDAGTGSFRNLNGVVEMDAMVMNSEENCGAVHCIQKVRNPIQVARMVMEKTPHSILTGSGAVQFARLHGFEEYEPALSDVKNPSEEIKGRERSLRDIQYYVEEIRKEDHIFSTVGVVALDQAGRLVAGTSTGGIRMKMPGRVGDSAIPGAGTYCTREIGLSATGEGEKILRMCLTYQSARDYLNTGKLTDSLRKNVKRASEIDCICGLIAFTRDGEFSFAHNGAFMPVYYRTNK
ncbi:MAG TPA: isoaspartyl peptidase/L-asparaginase family protein [Sphaerochaeta sp.]|jgi:beta-aspartyl-peptidase (threonine type)|nr:isoaspartyl peptidase/L-asparaginase family protein [Spirochaetota bacterium]HOE90056.1 isoaspartyl peptidase/L-asparaginase family protein [Sphaerochaeta sp.]HRV24253.1 isoaspartyl peptidase/L-asparaginase family protein [Sphaerochaeta sp.]